ncbi:breast cancer type 2 susceptibility protein homolog [Nylanderia fulva]|uniref:breast cancer type 2 susceptibility protein homolog n=1 Tax=Nylanderia fulva TaxID=613905 RepID=UPI0010FB46C2|nr:breast cancer type 2 susceptibility protein homolog [Nylanderia fulva]
MNNTKFRETDNNNAIMESSIIDDSEDESDELFSDDEQKEIKCDALILNRFETPSDSIIVDNKTTDAIPCTPLSLLPLLSKINEQWSSDFETPQAQPDIKSMTSTTEKREETSKYEQHTPDISIVKSVDKIMSASPIIAVESRASRRRSKRRIFRSSISTDPLVITNNEDSTVDVPIETSISKNINSAVQNSATNVAEPISSVDNILEDCESEVFNKIENICNNEELKNLTNITPDNLDTSTQEFFRNVSFSNIDQVCLNTFNNETTVKSTVHCNQRIKDTDKDRNNEENQNIGFFTAHGASINVSKQAVFKAKRLFADAFDIDETQAQNYESFAKRNSNEQTNKHLSSSYSFVDTVSINTTKEILSKSERQITEHDKTRITNCEEPFVNKSSIEEINTVPTLFSTASGASINISKEALSKAKTLLVDEKDNDKLIKYSESPSTNKSSIKSNDTTLTLFSTADGKPINISEKSLAKAKKLLADEAEKKNDILIKYPEKSFMDVNSMESNNMTSTLFSTAGGKPISISEKSLAKAKKLLVDESEKENDISIKHSENSFTNMNSMQPNDMTSTLFSTAGGKPINISEKSLVKAKKLLADEAENKNDMLIKYPEKSLTDVNSMESNNMTSTLFSTADGKPINISEKSLAKAKKLLADEAEKKNDVSIKYPEKSFTDVNSMESNNMTSTLFSTAGGKPINISEKSLAKAKKLLADEAEKKNDVSIKYPEKSFTDVNSMESNNMTSTLFSTAGGKSINISEKSLAKAKKLLADEAENKNDMLIKYPEKSFTDVNSMESNNMTSTLFSTAGGKSINISEKSLAKAKKLLADEEKKNDISIKYPEKSFTDINSMESNNMTSTLFSTAGGKPINISEKSLAKAKKLLADEAEKKNDVSIKYPEKSFTDINSMESNNMTSTLFSTAGGKPINISEKSLAEAKKLLADEAEKKNDVSIKYPEKSFTDINSMESNNMTSTLFSTAGGKSINISEKSLAKAKKLLADEAENKNDMLIKYPEKSLTDVNSMESNNMTSALFSTAGGKSINISEKSLAKAKILFAEQFDTTVEEQIISNKIDVFDNKQCDINTSNIKSCTASDKKIKGCDLKISYDGLHHLESDQEITVSSNALLKSRTFFSDNHLENNSPNLRYTSLHKSNNDNSDENTPLSRDYMPESKKARFSNELQARKLSFDDMDIDMDNDENRNPDKKNSVLRSAESDVESLELDVMSSPVLGTHSRKRKDLGHRRDKCASRADRTSPNKEENVASRGDIAHKDTSCKNTDMNESDTEMQMERQKEENNTESSEYSDTQLMMYFVDESAKILQDRLTAALEQEKVVTSKRRHGSKQSLGHLYRYKQVHSKVRLSLREISSGASPVPLSYQELVDRRISPSILGITAATASSYTFRCSDFYGNEEVRTNVRGIEMEDEVRLILDENGYVGIWEFLRAFLASSGVDPNLVPARWVENHYRWIVWKLASMDRMKFGSAKLPRALTPSRVMAQLKYRYDREIDQFQRSAIRRILEKDDVASKRMILCVSSIEETNVNTEIGKSPRIGVPKWRIELTDGWYSVPVCIDIGLVKSISTGKVREGTKLVISGAELLNCDQGFYPLEAPASVCLKLHTNSTRRARWDAKLGYTPCSGPIPIKLHNVCPNGGLIGKMTIIVARVYPTLYHEKTASGDSIIRNAKSEAKAQSTYEQQCLSKIEVFYANAERDFQKLSGDKLDEDYKSSSSQKSASKKRRSDELLQELQQEKETFMQDLQSKLRKSLPEPRQVSQLLKVRVCDENVNAILSIWSPGEEVVNALREGACVSLYNVVASGRRGTELQLTARRSSIFKPVKMHDTSYPTRVYTSFCEMVNSEFAPPYGEFDTVGFVCSVGPAPYGMKDFEVVHLAYPKRDSNDSLYLSILFWQGIAGYGYTDILTVGSIVACSNLEWRRATSWNIPAAYCTDRTIFTCNPRRNHLYEAFENLQNLITDPIKYAERCTFALNVELQKKSTPTRYVTSKSTPIKIYNSIASSVDKRCDYTSPLAAPRSGADSSPSYVASNPSIQRRLEKLQYYGEPPELSPLMLRKSKRVSLNFQSPIRLSSDSTKDASNIDQSGDPDSSGALKKI